MKEVSAARLSRVLKAMTRTLDFLPNGVSHRLQGCQGYSEVTLRSRLLWLLSGELKKGGGHSSRMPWVRWWPWTGALGAEGTELGGGSDKGDRGKVGFRMTIW